MIFHLMALAYKNIYRNATRSVLTLSAIVFAVAILIFGNAYINGIFDDFLHEAVRENGHVVIQTKEFTKKEQMLVLGVPVPDAAKLLADIEALDDVKLTIPRLSFSASIEKTNGTENVAVIGTGVDFQVEKEFLHLEDNIVAGSVFTGEENEVLIGAGVARILEVQPDDIIRIYAMDKHGSPTATTLKVVGVLDWQSKAKNKSFYMKLDEAYNMLDVKGEPQKIICVLNDSLKSGAVKNAVIDMLKDKGYENIDVFKGDETGLFQAIFPIFLFMLRFILFLFLIVALIHIANSSMMNVLERTTEAGVLEAMGFKTPYIVFMFLFETFLTGLMGSLIGALIATPISYYFQEVGIQIGESVSSGMPIPMKTVIYASIDAELVIMYILVGVVSSILAGLIPAFRLFKMNPSEAIRGD